ncbi:acyltransferase family protein [Janibacter sp. UYMM211]|uniref:acyltransferase family protein n=1 Tax=Janibacter sp. UYMM211 TaxID=3156342 RepID=UPI003398A96D
MDGLRALAVLAVVVYHGVERALPGGWFGVDVFFVISGFLITSLLLAEHRRWGSIHLAGFWLARMRRLLPALFLVLLAVVALTALLSPVGQRASVGTDVLATLGYVANWRFLLGDEAYFAQIAVPSPLRHTWSLAVEEQFYLLFPLVLSLLLVWTRRRVRIALVLGGLALVSAALMAGLHTPGADVSRVYYGTDTRAHELLAGAMVAALVARGPGALPAAVARRVDQAARVAALPALLLVLSCFWWATAAQDALLGGLLLPMCLAVAVVVLAAASSTPSPTQRLLALEPLRRVGLVSYGLYLWHWPVMIFLTPARTGLPELATFALQVVLSLALAAASYRWVEQPVRHHGARALVPSAPWLGRAIAFAAVPALITASLSLPAIGALLRPVSTSPDDVVTVRASPYRPGPEVLNIYLVGNSVPASVADAFEPASYPDISLTSMTNVGCDLTPAAKVADGEAVETTPECMGWRDDWGSAVADGKADVVALFVPHTFLVDRLIDGQVRPFGSPEHSAYIRQQLRGMVQDLSTGGAKVVLVDLACHRMPDLGNEEIKRINNDKYTEELNALVRAWAESHDIPVMDQFGLLCSGGYRAVLNGDELYGDGIHFTQDSGETFWTWLAPQLQAVGEDRPLTTRAGS